MANSLSTLRPVLGLAACLALLAPILPAQATIDDDVKVILPDGTGFDGFGRAIAVGPGRLLISGNGIDSSGAVVSYGFAGGQWVPQQEFKASDTVPGDFFGFDMDLDGTQLVVGAYQQDEVGLQTGAAYVFELVGGSWVETQKLVAPDPVAFDYFGRSVAIRDDLLVVGCSANDQLGTSAGAVYVYRNVGGTWTFEQKLTASTADVEDQFGWDVLTDGTMILASALEDEEGGGTAGAVFQFDWNGSTWTETQRFTDPSPQDGARFGWNMDLEGSELFVGATDHPGGGRVAIFDNGGGSWAFQQAITPSKLTSDHAFGWSVDASFDRLLVGAPGAEGFAGAVYQFHHDGTRWVEVQEGVTGEPVTGFPPAQLGMSCALFFKTGFGGAPFANTTVAGAAGAAYVFDLSDIGLDAVPDDVPLMGDMVLESYGGLAFDDMGIYVINISGVPINAWLLFDNFDADGKQVTSIPMPAAASGLSMTLVTLGYWKPGKVGFSDLVTVNFL